MNTEMTDYVILSVENPAFQDNVRAMIDDILKAGGTAPTEHIYYIDGQPIPDTDPIEYEQIPVKGINTMVGTGVGNGRMMLHFRLPKFYNAADLITFLETNMIAPKPPISVESIRSAYKIVWVDDGVDPEGNPIGHYGYEITVPAMRARFLPYIPENTDENGNPNGTINEFLSGYYGTEPILLQ